AWIERALRPVYIQQRYAQEWAQLPAEHRLDGAGVEGRPGLLRQQAICRRGEAPGSAWAGPGCGCARGRLQWWCFGGPAEGEVEEGADGLGQQDDEDPHEFGAGAKGVVVGGAYGVE